MHAAPLRRARHCRNTAIANVEKFWRSAVGHIMKFDLDITIKGDPDGSVARPAPAPAKVQMALHSREWPCETHSNDL